MTIVFKRWHWLLFAFLWLVSFFAWWMTLKAAPGGTGVLEFLQSWGWMRVPLAIVLTAAPAFLTTVILAKVFPGK